MVANQRRIPEQLGGVLGRYVLLDTIGAGGMGVVHRALDPIGGQHFAIKVLSDTFRVQPSALRLLEQEAATQATIVHPNVVQLFELVQAGGHTGLVMELVDGSSLAETIQHRQGRPLSLGQFAWLAMQMTMGLNVVHHHGYVHSDVKPANFLYGRSQSGETVVKVADFGVARRLEEQKRIIAGTYGYMSPEQMSGDPLTVASDVYGLGCVFHQLLAGEPVFAATDPQVLARKHCEDEPPRLTLDMAPAPVADLILHMLEKNPSSRLPTAEAVLYRLQEITS